MICVDLCCAQVLASMEKLKDKLELDHNEVAILKQWLYQWGEYIKKELPKEKGWIECCEWYVRGYP